MVTQTDKEGKAEAPPYVSFKTLWNFLDKLGEVGTPPRIDRSVWGDNLSGGYGFQLMAALRFLGLADDEGMASGELRQIAEDVAVRKKWLRERLVSFYGEPIRKLDLAHATMQQLQEAFRASYSVTGATSDKSISFFLGAARAGEIPLSPYIERNVRRRSTTNKPRRKPKPPQQIVNLEGKVAAASGAVGTLDDGDKHERIITLRSGGTVKLSLDYNPFKLSKADRDFLFLLIDKIQGYEGEGGDKG